MPSRRRPSPALIVSIIALVMASAGTATAAKVLISSSSQIKKGAVNGGDVADGSLSSKDFKKEAVDAAAIRDGSVGADELAPATRQAITGATTSAQEAFRKAGPNGQEADKLARVITFNNIEPGVYAIFAKTVLTLESNDAGLLGQGKSAAGHCVLDASGDKDESRALLGSPGSAAPGEVNTQLTRTFSSTGTVTLECSAGPGPWHATDSSIVALKVAKAPRQSVDG
jgi:hypothetical protein